MVQNLYHFMMSECVLEIMFLYLPLLLKPQTKISKKWELVWDVKMEICIFDNARKSIDKKYKSVYSTTVQNI